jgi:MFS superfamily sulfate permease-like transporter
MEGVLVFRADSGWFYANAAVMEEQLTADLDALPAPPRLVVIDLATAPMVDLGVIDTLADLVEDLRQQDIRVEFANVYALVADRLHRHGELFATVQPNESIAAILQGEREAGSGRLADSTSAST